MPGIVDVVRVPPLDFFVNLKALVPKLQPTPDLLKFIRAYFPSFTLFLNLNPISAILLYFFGCEVVGVFDELFEV